MDESQLMNLVRDAKRAGAEAVEVAFAERQALSVQVRLGALEEVEREESNDLGIRALIGRRQASVSGSDLSVDGRARLVERVVAMARLAPEDRYAGLPDRTKLANGARMDLALLDDAEPTAETLEADAREAEDAARATPKVTNSSGASASWSRGAWRLATSDGFFGEHRGSVFSIGVGAIAGEGGAMEQGYEGLSRRWRGDLPSPANIGAEAGRRAAAALGGRKIASTTAPVIFENRVAGGVLAPLMGAISGPSVARGVSFLKDRLGQPVFSAAVTITDDPHRPRGLGSSPFDDEGVANRPMALIDAGVLTTWMLNSSSARQLGMETTGHASRGLAGPPGVGASNPTLEAGDDDLASLMRAARSGLFVTAMFGPSLNANTGDWSVGCSGHWFENGEIAYPVTEITVAGNLVDIYRRLSPGSDLELRGAANAPSLLIDGLAIAGL
ncbi:MAG: TldD/PmbA family protein [Caulobacteraceae bacterium]|nr:TldD/PmbA family protein [Caulobacteraceae bacterium]